MRAGRFYVRVWGREMLNWLPLWAFLFACTLDSGYDWRRSILVLLGMHSICVWAYCRGFHFGG